MILIVSFNPSVLSTGALDFCPGVPAFDIRMTTVSYTFAHLSDNSIISWKPSFLKTSSLSASGNLSDAECETVWSCCSADAVAWISLPIQSSSYSISSSSMMARHVSSVVASLCTESQRLSALELFRMDHRSRKLRKCYKRLNEFMYSPQPSVNRLFHNIEMLFRLSHLTLFFEPQKKAKGSRKSCHSSS